MTRHLLDVTDLDAGEVRQILDLAALPPAALGRPLDGLGAALIFEKPSNRTRQSMEMAVFQLGGHPVYTQGEEVGFDTREPVEDVVRIMEGYHAVHRAPGSSTTDGRADGGASPPCRSSTCCRDHSHPLQALRRRADDGAGARPAGRQDRRVGRRLQQRRPLARRDRRDARRPPALRLPGRLQRRPTPSSSGSSCSARPASTHDPPPRRGRRRRPRRARRHVGVDGPGGREGRPQAGVRGLHRRRAS